MLLRLVFSIAFVPLAAAASATISDGVVAHNNEHSNSRSLQQQYECQLSAPIALNNDGNLFLEHVKNSDAGTYTMRLTYTGGQSWVGIGINSDGESKMIPASAVIGRGDDNSVRHYMLFSNAKDGSGVQPYSSNTLQNARFTQTSTDSILEFTQDLNEMGVSDDSTWIFAVGLADNAWEGKHDIYGSFQLALTDGCQKVATSSTATAPSSSPQQSTTETTNTMADTEGEDEWEEDSQESEDDLVGGTSTTSSGSTTTTTTSTSGQFATANSNSNSIVFQDTTHPYKSLWIAHGALMAIAWGFLAPLAIGASILRSLIGRYLGDYSLNWYSFHYYLNMGVVLLTLLGFTLAVVATEKEGKQHFRLAGSGGDDNHHKIGLAIAILVVVQGTAGYFRPGMPKPVEAPTGKDVEDGDVETSPKEEAAPEPASEPVQPKKPMLRLLWEWSHRLLGMALLGLAWYNCHTGIQWQQENWEDSKDWTGVFWGVTIGISCVVVVLSYGMRLS